MNETISVHITYPPADLSLEILRSELDPAFNITTGKTIPAPDALQYLVNGRPTTEQLETCSNLRSVIIPFAGIPAETRDLLKKYPHISVHNLHHNAVPVVENTIALLLAAAKHLIPPHNALRGHDWRPRYADDNPSTLLQGKTALVLGYGAIGSRLARILRAFEMRVLAMRNSIDSQETDAFAEIYPARSLNHLLPRADVLINTLPLTPQTNGLIGEKELSFLPEGAIVVNVGRGKVINQHAFYQSLKNGHLRAAAIDVWYQYPEKEQDRAHTQPAEAPFEELENVVLSPHRAGGLNSLATERLRMQHLADLLNHGARGEPLPNQVDLARGY